VPTAGELGLLKWRPGGGNAWCATGTPMVGKTANHFQKVAREIYAANGMDYTIMNVCGARFARGLHVITFNREDPDECRRADATYRGVAEAFAKAGVQVGRAPVDYYDFHMAKASPAFRAVCSAIKAALDPNGIIAPGKYGIG
jgi:4-cresol dehydrogenase (hydroxylating)